VITLFNHSHKIPYASTFDGGLGCFASGWTNSGHDLRDLYTFGTHRCVDRSQNSGKFELTCVDCPILLVLIAHGAALNNFYRSALSFILEDTYTN
jgi:hypothetical protein